MFVFDDPKAQWKPIATAPFDRDLELAVIDSAGIHVLSFPCRRAADGWVNVETGKLLYNMRPTHWREWPSPSKSTSSGQRSPKPYRLSLRLVPMSGVWPRPL
jgi:hypothetical protein